MLPEHHPDLHQDFYRLKQIDRGGMQALETTAMNAMWDAIEAGKGREEVEEIFFSFFNKNSHGKQRSTSVSAIM